MAKETLGSVVKSARLEAKMSQRELGETVGIKGSHIAYIETARRRPSIPLVKRLASVLRVSARELLLLAYPEAREIFESEKPKRVARDAAWREFTSNAPLLKRHRVTAGELKVLKQVSMLNPVSQPEDFVFVLKAMRLAAEH